MTTSQAPQGATDGILANAVTGPPPACTTPGLRLAWGSGALGVALLMNSVGGLILFYMVSILHIEPALAGSLIFVSKLLGVVTDPMVGTWSDRLQTSGSRRRPFLLAGAMICAGSYVMIFTTPLFDGQALRAGYVFVALLIYTAGYSLFNVPFMAMPAEMTDQYHERTAIHSVRMMFVAVAGLIVGSVFPLLLEHFGRLAWGSYALLGCIGGAIILASTLVAWGGTSSARFSTAQVQRPRVMAEIGHVFANRHFLRLLGVKFTQLLGVAATQAASMYFLLNVLQAKLTLMAPAALVATLVQLVAAPVLVWLSRRIGKAQTYIFGAVLYVLTVASWALASPDEPAWAYVLRLSVIAFGACGNVIMAMSMLTDIISLDAQTTGIRREGVFTAFYSFTEKFTFAFGPLIVGVALSAAGFDKNLPPEVMQTPAIRQALLLGVCYIPAVLGIVSIALLAGYKLKQEDLK
ncbi:MFS transporter [Novosphingobium sp. FSY-8]|uniref:MFS transporter n=1 Tax=Novosphingobium ovatum TaxID=1908523 RepID=A0ABW9XI71_9SPHN|nr:MFS transporter [Novosphingobium ovatum]NBC38153.1 MFS transporter [Novosphingobium ovatum]